MKIHSVTFDKDIYKLGAGANNETRATFTSRPVGAPDSAGRPIPPQAGIEIWLVYSGSWVLVRSSSGETLMVPREKVKEIVLPGKSVDGKWIADKAVVKEVTDG